MIYKIFRTRAAAALMAASSIVTLATGNGCSSPPAELPGDGDGDSGDGDAGCGVGLSICGGACFDLSTSSANCGTCGTACSAGSSCVAGSCSCSAGYASCNGVCTNPLEDASNCGGCGVVCGGATPFCSQGACSATCPLTTCGTTCADVQTSEVHCGGCNIACTDGKECVAGACTCPVGVSCEGVPPATGGASGTGGGAGTGGVGPGTGGAIGTGGGDLGTGGGEGEGLLGGYHVHGDWAGFAFTFVDTAGQATITPGNFEDMVDRDGPYCVSGNVPATADYSAIAAVGFNTNQDKIDDAPVNLVASTGDGIVVDVTVNSGASVLRVQLEDGTDPGAADAAMHRWCANIPGTGRHELPWDSFTTECWDAELSDTNVVFDNREIAKVIIYVPDPGPMGTAQPFDFCINDIGPSNVTSRGTGEILAACPSNGTTWSQTTSDTFLKIGDGAYRFQSNLWNLVNGGTSLKLIPGGGFRFEQQSCNTTTDAPCSFPSVYIGTNAGGDARSSGYTPKQISAITSIPTCLGWSSGGSPASDEYNVSYDVWFNSDSGASSAEKFLMVWFRDPPSFQPGGMFPIANGTVIGGQTWSVWSGPQHEGRTVVSYVAPNTRADGQAYSFNLKDFIDDAVERGELSPSQYLIAVMGGMEVWGGAQGASLTGFTAQVN